MTLRNMTTIYIRKKDRLLMLYRIGSRVVPPSWCGIGGHFEQEEWKEPKACVLRELLEETGITEADIGDVKLKYVTLRNKHGEIRQNYYFFAELVRQDVTLGACDEGVLEWVHLGDVMGREMPFTAEACLRHYFSMGHADENLYAGIATETGVDFVAMREF